MIREIAEIKEFDVTDNNEAKYNTIFKKTPDGKITKKNPSKYLYDYLEAQGVILDKNIITPEDNGISASDTIENSNNEILF